ncbi:hypothetical protein M378DRAFT_731634 [Amanita muscaria Koide BX008]|uniref:Uncharacterized protein n=1 Tax=Amanita muscaria (strain Koide BX008) TaxID=946122 RepID=A0A0C2WN63_AMAMK|nr:hypothetical protein M378DRAFT_731634 [Amanita muscaria Koide BX008]
MQHEDRLDSHDVESGAGRPSDWTFKASFGVVHAKGCSICSSYMTHLIIANDSNNASFQVAIRDRECLVSKAFLDGAQNGRELQQEYDVPVLDRYRKELDKALQSLEQRQKLLDAAKQEIGVLQDRTLALQMQLDSSVSSKITLHNRSAKSDPSSMERLLLHSSEDVDLDSLSPLSPTAGKKALPIIPDLLTVSEDNISMPSSSFSPDSLDTAGMMNSLAELGSQASQAPPLPTSKPKSPPLIPSTHTQRPEPPAPNQVKPTPEPAPQPATPMLKPFTPNSFPTQTPQGPSHITTIAQLQALMDAAHAGDVSALKRVKFFSGTAYQTPISKRTELQHYIVKYWRKTPRSPSVPAQMNAVGSPFHTEIYVDASQWGIGFVMDGMWSAWKFSDSLALSSNSFDISWAEMVAVEVGLWTVIHWVTIMVQNEGEQLPLEIDVRCDNAGVVKAIEKRHTGCLPQQDVLQRIFEVNLADDPSRGVGCHGTTQLPLVPSLPSYLSDILNPISTNK